MACLETLTRGGADPQGKLFKMKSERACKNDGSRYTEPPGGAKGHRVIATSTIMGKYEVIICTITSKDQVPGIEFLPIAPTVASASYWQFPLQLRQSIDQYEATDLRAPSYIRLEPFKVPFEMLLPHASSIGGHLALGYESIGPLWNRMGALGLIKPFYSEWEEEKRKAVEERKKNEAALANYQMLKPRRREELERKLADPEAYKKECEEGMRWQNRADAMEEHGGFD